MADRPMMVVWPMMMTDRPITVDGPMMVDRPMMTDGPMMAARPMTADGPMMAARPMTADGPMMAVRPGAQFLEPTEPRYTPCMTQNGRKARGSRN